MKYSKKTAVKAVYDLISSVEEAHEKIKEIAYDAITGEYYYMNEFMIVRTYEYLEAGYPLVDLIASHLKPFVGFLDHAEKNTQIDIDLPDPEEVKAAGSGRSAIYSYRDGYYINPVFLLIAYKILGTEELHMRIPENPVYPVFLWSHKGEACIYPKRRPETTYSRNVKGKGKR